jgi:hypothetical protein
LNLKGSFIADNYKLIEAVGISKQLLGLDLGNALYFFIWISPKLFSALISSNLKTLNLSHTRIHADDAYMVASCLPKTSWYMLTSDIPALRPEDTGMKSLLT